MSISAMSKYDQISSTRLHALGQGQYDPLGRRVFHYALAGGTTLARGKINVAATIAANHVNLNFQTAPAIGELEPAVTLGATAATADQYRDGWFVVQDGTGEGRAYPIEGNPAADASATCKFRLKEAIDTAGALSEANVDLIKNKYDGVVISVADQADPPVGVNIVSITNAYYGWQQTWGPAAVLMDETLAVGSMVVLGESVVGAVQVDDGAAESIVGWMGPQAGVDTEYQLVYLAIDPLY